MKRFFQMFVDYDDEKESVPVRIDPEKIVGFRKYGSRTIVYTDSMEMEELMVKEEYEHFSTRLFTFIDEGETHLSSQPQQKKFLVKRKVKNLVEESYFDHNQPETNC